MHGLTYFRTLCMHSHPCTSTHACCHMHSCTLKCTHMHMHTHTLARIYIHTSMIMHVYYVRPSSQVGKHARLHTQTCMHVCGRIYVDTYMYTL